MAGSDAPSSLSDDTASCINAAISSTPPRLSVDAAADDELRGQDRLALSHSNVRVIHAPGDCRKERLATLSALGDDLVSTARLAATLAEQYEESRNLADLERSIAIHEAILFLIPAPHSPLYAETMCGLGLASNQEPEVPEAPDDVAARDHHQAALSSAQRYDNRVIKTVSKLARMYGWKAMHTEEPNDIGTSIRAQTQLLRITSPAPENAHRNYHLCALADLCCAYLLVDNLAGNDLERLIQSHEYALARTPTSPGFRPDRFNLHRQLLLLHQKRFTSTGDTEDLDMCIRRGSEALELMEGAQDQRPLFEDLGDVYYLRYKTLRAIQDLDSAIEYCQKALRLVPHGDAHHSWLHSAVLIRLDERFRATNMISDLDTWVDACEQALHEPHEKVKPHLLHLYASALKARYLAVGADADVSACIDFCKEALLSMPPENPAERIYILRILSKAYLERFARTDAAQDMEAALRFCHEACDPNLSLESGLTHGSALGEIYLFRYVSTGLEADFEAAIQHLHSVIHQTSPGSSVLDSRKRNLAELYYEKFNKTRQLPHLDTAISILRDHLGASRERIEQSPQCQKSLSIFLVFRYLATRSVGDIDDGIQQAQIYLGIVDGGSPEYPEALVFLGGAYATRYRQTNDPADLNLAIQNKLNVFRHGMADASSKFTAGIFLCLLFSAGGNWRAAFDQAAQTMSLIPTLTPWSLSVSDKRQQLLFLKSSFASEAAAITLQAAEPPHEAIKMLELGRGVIVGALADMRSEIPDLGLHDKSLAGELSRLRRQLESSAGQNERYRKAQEFNALLSRVRGHAGWENFLHAPGEEEIRAVAAAGPIVVINATKWRCDALIVTEGLIECLALPRVNYAEVERRAAMSPSRLALRDLEWLWETMAEPILLHLGFTQRPDPGGPWPRIWWVLTGPLTNLPIHAAGRYSGVDLSSDTVLDRVISSYATSIKTLIHARRGSVHPLRDGAKAVLFGISATPGMARLPSVREEVAEVSKLCASLQLDVVHPQPRHEDVLAALRDDCQVFHFAGHGRNYANPMKSGLVLSGDPPLTVADLFDLNLQVQRPYLAFLSACSTSHIGDDRSVDEGLHLAIACQLAGFQHAVGSLWEVEDAMCVSVARLLYEWLVNHGMGRGSVAEGLHHASRQLRDKWFAESGFRETCRRRLGGERRGMKRESVSEAACDASEIVTGERSARTVVVADDDPGLLSLFWAPYVHFGI